jgi:hypothetical protein
MPGCLRSQYSRATAALGGYSYVTDGILGVQMEAATETCFSVKDSQSSGMNGKYFFLDCLTLKMKALQSF